MRCSSGFAAELNRFRTACRFIFELGPAEMSSISGTAAGKPWRPAGQRANDQEKEPVWTLICAWRLCRRRNTPDRPLEILDIFPSAAAIPVRTDLICTRTVRANLLQTPRRAQSCHLFAGSSRAQSIPEHFRDEILLPLQIQFERASVNLLRELLHLLELSIRRRLCGRRRVRRDAPGDFYFIISLRNISKPALICSVLVLDFLAYPLLYPFCAMGRGRGEEFLLPPEMKCVGEKYITKQNVFGPLLMYSAGLNGKSGVTLQVKLIVDDFFELLCRDPPGRYSVISRRSLRRSRGWLSFS